ncbi:uncharacterized mitochondrial protein-like protein [Tanacetum coccineum]
MVMQVPVIIDANVLLKEKVVHIMSIYCIRFVYILDQYSLKVQRIFLMLGFKPSGEEENMDLKTSMRIMLVRLQDTIGTKSSSRARSMDVIVDPNVCPILERDFLVQLQEFTTDHPLEQSFEIRHPTPQTRSMTIEPKKVIQALTNPSWIEAMQDELLQFKLQKIDVKSDIFCLWYKEKSFVCQPLGFEDQSFLTSVQENGFRRGTIDKTLFIKKDKDDILLVHVYIDDIIFGSTKKSLCIEFEQMMHKRFQMSSMGELTFFLRLQTASIPIGGLKQSIYSRSKKLEFVDVHFIQINVGIFDVLNSFLTDIMFSVCACARLQSYTKDFTSLCCGRESVDINRVRLILTLINETQEIYDEEILFDIQDDLQGEEVVTEKEVVEKEVSAADPVTTVGEVVTTASATTIIDELTLAQTLTEI